MYKIIMPKIKRIVNRIHCDKCDRTISATNFHKHLCIKNGKKCIKCGKTTSSYRERYCKSCCRKGIIFTEQHKQNIGVGTKNSGKMIREHVYTKKSRDAASNRLKAWWKQHPDFHTVKGIKFTEEHKQKIREATLKQVENGTGSFAIHKYKDNKSTEKKFEDIINNIGLKEKVHYVKQFRIGNITCSDFYFYLTNTHVFIDGNYWHCNPTMYRYDYYHKKIGKTAKEIWKKDRCYAKIIEQKGFNVIRIWESDLDNTSIVSGAIKRLAKSKSIKTNKKCPYYPCHKVSNQTCTSCYCAKYPCQNPSLGRVLRDGTWDCSFCIDVHLHTSPHIKKELTQ